VDSVQKRAEDGCLRWVFTDVETKASLECPVQARSEGHIRLAFELRLESWESCALQIGWCDEDEHYWQLRLPYERDGEWQEGQLCDARVEFGIHNAWKRPGDEIRSLRIDVAGSGRRASLDLRRLELSTLSPEQVEPRLVVGEREIKVSDVASWKGRIPTGRRDQVLLDYFLSEEDRPETYAERARSIREDGLYRLESAKPVAASIAFRDRRGDSQENSWRFRWNALDACKALVAGFVDSDDLEFLYLAREHGLQWIEENLERPPADSRYAWYDHGTALRAMSLLMLWDLGCEKGFDLLTKARLLQALHAHGELLRSEAFVARNQPYRVHNHALFQAVALLFIGRLTPLVEAPEWLEVGRRRCLGMVSDLLSAEGASVENSYAYHRGLRLLVVRLAEVFEAYDLDGHVELSERMKEMAAFERSFQFPNGIGPSNGDSWHVSVENTEARIGRRSRGEGDPSADDRVYPDAGYAVLRRTGSEGWLDRQVTLLCSSKNITHKHHDHLSILIWAGGIEWIADPGLYRYAESDVHAAFFRHARAHNAPVIEEADYDPVPGSAVLEEWSSGPQSRLLASHTAYPGRRIEREVRLDRDEDRVVVEDRVQGAPPRGLDLWFHAGFGVSVEAGDDGAVLLTHPASENTVLIEPDRASPPELELFRGQSEPFAAGWIYIRGGIPVPTAAWRWRWHGTGGPLTTTVSFGIDR
jgi:hypothetical protein